jgi:hypothetical protein
MIRYLLSLAGNQLRVLISLTIGHWCLKRHLHTMALENTLTVKVVTFSRHFSDILDAKNHLFLLLNKRYALALGNQPNPA